ncbi:hypothetical protein C0J52_07352 [Blattella germanica]|nr:hypothetical protein C0J52_07352 [Blattella germanica]
MELMRTKYSCKFPNCRSSYHYVVGSKPTQNKHFYMFPNKNKKELLQEWRKVCNIPEDVNCENFRVCEDHFHERDFTNYTHSRLNRDVVPKDLHIPSLASASTLTYSRVSRNRETQSKLRETTPHINLLENIKTEPRSNISGDEKKKPAVNPPSSMCPTSPAILCPITPLKSTSTTAFMIPKVEAESHSPRITAAAVEVKSSLPKSTRTTAAAVEVKSSSSPKSTRTTEVEVVEAKPSSLLKLQTTDAAATAVIVPTRWRKMEHLKERIDEISSLRLKKAKLELEAAEIMLCVAKKKEMLNDLKLQKLIKS